LQHIETLSSDRFAGRAPGTPGEALTLSYLVDTFSGLGLRGAGPDGGFLQPVPVIGITSRPQLRIELDSGASAAGSAGPAPGRASFSGTALRFPDDYVALSRRAAADVAVQGSPLVFVGYGVVAPEYDWDDYKGVDVRGKTLIMLVNDPQVPDPAQPGRLDARLFQGEAMTYYGRWTYKYEIAAKLGAAAAFIVHETGPAGYPYAVVRSWGREHVDLDGGNGNRDRVAVEGWLSQTTAAGLLGACGQDLEALKRAAIRRDFVPVPLLARAYIEVKNDLRSFVSHNVVARLDGTDAKRRTEVVVYSAHWDHLGQVAETGAGPPRIYHGAIDNASGVAALLEIARGLREARLRRTFLFLLPTAEEYGLLGAHYYAEHPLYPLRDTVADINLDMMNVWGRTLAIANVAYGLSELDETLKRVAATQGREVHGDPDPLKGYFFRADSFEFAKAGVPVALFMRPGLDFRDRAPGFAQVKAAAFTAADYHNPSDVVKADWDLRGTAEDVELLVRLGRELDRTDGLPSWKAGAGFTRR
jgi:Zn-dependent M28 family amino/carboxypeptidase